MSEYRDILRARHSSHLTKSPQSSDESNYYSKSDLNVTIPSLSLSSRSTNLSNITHIIDNTAQGEYYKKYEHDEVPVKDSNIHSNNKSLTNTELEKLEVRVFSNVSQELQTDECSLTSLEPNIKFFKLTVEKIFESFYTSMRDYDVYKQRFQDILEKSKEGSFEDMEDFIKDMFEHLLSETSTSSANDFEKHISSGDNYSDIDSAGVTEAYKNENYNTDHSTTEGKTNSCKDCFKIDDIINVFLLDGNPCVQIKLNDRNLLSEINLKEDKKHTTQVASADNLTNYNTRQNDVDQYYMSQQLDNVPDRNIPVKVSSAKKNIYLNEDFAPNSGSNDTTKSFLSKICNILCKKFRRTTIG